MDDERGAIVTEGGQFREGALQLGRITRCLNVGHAPVRMELLHLREAEWRVGDGARQGRKKGVRETGEWGKVKALLRQGFEVVGAVAGYWCLQCGMTNVIQ